jgi:DNA-binding transcriptional MocR family regulator
LKPGDKLPSENTIVLEHGVSRTVVREAISKLQASGLVEPRHGIGTFVLAQQPPSGLRLHVDTVASVRSCWSCAWAWRPGRRAGRHAPQRRQLARMRQALDDYQASLAATTAASKPTGAFTC